MSNLEALEEKLHDLSYVLSREEINELRSLCYEHSNSWCPLSDFFNDIYLNKSETYNKNQAFKDLWLIVLIVLDKKKELKALQIIKEKRVDVNCFLIYDLERYNSLIAKNEFMKLIQEEYDLLKDVLL